MSHCVECKLCTSDSQFSKIIVSQLKRIKSDLSWSVSLSSLTSGNMNQAEESIQSQEFKGRNQFWGKGTSLWSSNWENRHRWILEFHCLLYTLCFLSFKIIYWWIANRNFTAFLLTIFVVFCVLIYCFKNITYYYIIFKSNTSLFLLKVVYKFNASSIKIPHHSWEMDKTVIRFIIYIIMISKNLEY